MSFDQDPNEQANISGADLAILIDELAAEIKNKQEFERDWLECCDKLAESQAREKVLRENLEEFGDHDTQCESGYFKRMAEGAAWMGTGGVCTCGFSSALAQPTDDSALKAALAKERDVIYQFVGRDFAHLEPREALEAWLADALAAERDRCASVCLDIVDGQQYAEAIRALGD